MKCPKCNYLGFETGDRCRNCGYDFSLLALADAPPHADLRLRPAPESSEHRREDAGADVDDWVEHELDRALGATHGEDVSISPPSIAAAAGAGGVSMTAAAAASPRAGAESRLPLFSRTAASDDEPLIRVAAAPRPPLSVRRTSESPRLKPLPLVSRREDEPELEFADRLVTAPAIVLPSGRPRTPQPSPRREASGAVPRGVAALVDIAILAAVDLTVVYFTLRMAALTMDDWRLLPPLPLLAFLLLLKLAYYSAFTAVGGQTIGKMTTRIRVVTENDGRIEPTVALQRTLAATASVITLGGAFAPALLGASKRAFHDRVAHTRVVALPPS